MAIIWTKEWEGSDDGTIVGGIDLKNLQDDLANVLQTGDSVTIAELNVTSGVITIPETTTPVAVASSGKIYTKSDNKLYFQDGAGTEHEIAFV